MKLTNLNPRMNGSGKAPLRYPSLPEEKTTKIEKMTVITTLSSDSEKVSATLTVGRNTIWFDWG